ncbi:hypothetical protein [Chengkuizengella marina]|uniref:DUF4358 domain-containing protein n=1 Tax=Chengkuizengella marina TaxID=2507566 RepID=A0A6N9Q6W5_9BACL|nr:hypothetical protein [Chengkuizengella marina]NBI30520.1 hypothetical protein [Chengkuizengella marina]
MNKMKLCFYVLNILLILILISCTNNNNNMKEELTLDDVTTTLMEEGIKFKEAERNSRSIFQLELNGVTPNVYAVQDNELSIYIFENEEERNKGMDEFKEKLGSAEIDVDKYTHEINNVTIFYLYQGEDIDEQMENAINKLSS